MPASAPGPSRQPGLLERCVVRAYRAVVAVFPRAFRRRFETDLVEAFTDGARDARRRGGRRGLLGFAARGLRDLATAGLGERWSHDRPGSRRSLSMETVVQDLRFALRTLRSAPGHTLAVVATMGLAIGATTAIFAVVDGILLRPLPFPGSERVVALCETSERLGDWCGASWPNARDWTTASSLADAGVARDWPFVWEDDGGTTSVRGGIATPGYLRVLGFRAAAGRLFGEDEMEEGANRAAVLAHAYWQRRYGGDHGIVGSRVLVDDTPATVVGVLEPDSTSPHLDWVEVWMPLTAIQDDVEARDWRGFRALGRLDDGVTLDAARQELAALRTSLAARHPDSNAEHGLRVLPFRDQIVGAVRSRLLIFLGAVGLVLLIACANVANLLLARGTRRARELAVRASLGAGRRRLAGQLLTESLVLAGAGGAVGFLLAIVATPAFLAMAPAGIPRLDEVTIDGRVLTFTTLLAAATALVSGLVPALAATRADVAAMLRGNRASGDAGAPVRRALVVAELALALMLLSGAGLLLRGFGSLMQWEPGFDRQPLVTAFMFSSDGRFPTGDLVVAHHREIARQVEALPGVASVGLTSAGPLFGGVETAEVEAPRDPAADPSALPVARWFDVDEGYLPTLGLELVRGRNFAPADTAGSRPVAIVNQTLAGRLWPDDDALGRSLTVQGRAAEVVGVVRDVPPLEPDAPVESWVLWPKTQYRRWGTYLVIRSRGEPTAVERPVRELLERLDPDLQVGGFVPLEEIFARNLVSPRFNVALIGLFAAAALALAAVGTYGVLSYSVASRTHEIGIRMALGARARDITATVVGSGMVLALLGLALGLAGTLAVARVLESMVYGVPAADPSTLTGVLAIFLVVALAACWIPARRAARLDPRTALEAR